MKSLIEGQRLVVASHNPGKVREIEELVSLLGVEVCCARDLGLPVPEETGESFEENARLKALAAVRATGWAALGDDSGLCVDALGGAPGIHTADWAGEERDFDRAMARVREELDKVGVKGESGAVFVCVLALAWPAGKSGKEEILLVRGEVRGRIVEAPRGSLGFGYDACFAPEGESRTFGEMDAKAKHGWRPGDDSPLSHRARAFSALWESLSCSGRAGMAGGTE